MSFMTFAACPFCTDPSGELAVNLDRAVHVDLAQTLTERQEGTLIIRRVPDQRLVVFDSQRDNAPPCEHLVYVDGFCRVEQDGRAEPWIVQFIWGHRLYDPSDARCDDYLFELYEDNVPIEALPSVGFHWEDFDCCRASREQRVSTDGLILFAEDVERFLTEVPLLPKAEI